MFLANMILCQCVAYTAVALLAEVNTIFLHARKLLQMLLVPFDSWVYRANSAANITTFVCCRFVCLAWITYGIIMYREIIGPRYYLAISTSTFMMSIINVVLFWRLLCSDYLRTHKRLLDATEHCASSPNGVTHNQVSAISVNGAEVGLLNGHAVRRRDLNCRPDSSGVIAEISDRVGKRLTVESHLPDFEGLMYYRGADAGHMTGMHLDFDGVIG
jgi:TLC domain